MKFNQEKYQTFSPDLSDEGCGIMEVTDMHTAKVMGSGTLDVLSTPALIAFMENTAMRLLSDLSAEETSVGTDINVQHLKASPVGEKIYCKASVTAVEGRKYTFSLEATDSHGRIIGKGTHERFVVNIEKFMGKLR